MASRQGDALNQLNVDDSELSYKEKSILDMLYPTVAQAPDETVAHQQIVNNVMQPKITAAINTIEDTRKVWHHFKDILVATVLFVLLSTPIADRLLQKVIKVNDANYLLAAKAVLFAFLLFLIYNFYLSRSSSKTT